MSERISLTLNSPITDEQWDMITDVDLDHTDRMWFHTKHGKEVEFAKVIRCKDCEYAVEEYDDGECYCDNKVNGMIYIGNDWNHFCSWAKRREE